MVRRYVEEVYDQRKLEVVDHLFASDFTLHDPDLFEGCLRDFGSLSTVERIAC